MQNACAGDRAFKPPTVADVLAYATEQDAPDFGAQRFVDYNEARGWRIAGEPIYSWQAAARMAMRAGVGKGGTGGMY